jgi:hypothetical protein
MGVNLQVGYGLAAKNFALGLYPYEKNSTILGV